MKTIHVTASEVSDLVAVVGIAALGILLSLSEFGSLVAAAGVPVV